MSKGTTLVGERAARWVFCVVATLVAVRWGLLGAGQLPWDTFGDWGAGIALFLSFIVWARSQLPIGDHPLIRRDAGFLMVVLAPVATLYYLVATRRSRPARASLTVGIGLVAPALTLLAGMVVASAVPIPPRYVQLAPGAEWIRVNAATGTEIARRDLGSLADFILGERRAGRPLPSDAFDLYARWLDSENGGWRDPYDPFTGLGYLYDVRDTGFVLWSSGPDKQLGNSDDVWYDWPARTDTMMVAGR